jgi:transcription factor E
LIINNGFDKKLKKILGETISDEHIVILEKLTKPRYDEDIAEELSEKAVTIRKLLNELHDKSLVQYVRTKNPKTGWYTYVWDRRNDKIIEYCKNYIQSKIDKIDEKLDNETNNVMFACSCSEEYEEYFPTSKAMENDFLCPKCNEYVTEFDNSNIIRDLEEDKTELTEELKKLDKVKITG